MLTAAAAGGAGEVPRAADVLRADHHRPGGAGLHPLGLPRGGRGPSPQEQPVQGGCRGGTRWLGHGVEAATAWGTGGVHPPAWGMGRGHPPAWGDEVGGTYCWGRGVPGATGKGVWAPGSLGWGHPDSWGFMEGGYSSSAWSYWVGGIRVSGSSGCSWGLIPKYLNTLKGSVDALGGCRGVTLVPALWVPWVGARVSPQSQLRDCSGWGLGGPGSMGAIGAPGECRGVLALWVP